MNESLRESEIMEMYSKLQQDQLKLMTEMKNDTMGVDDKDTTKLITQLNSLTIGLLRFRNLKKSIEKKKDL